MLVRFKLLDKALDMSVVGEKSFGRIADADFILDRRHKL